MCHKLTQSIINFVETKTKKMNRYSKLFLGLMIIGLSSCASIPKATVDMSTLLGRQIDALEQSHISTLNAYFDEKEQSAIAFLDEVWYRRYLTDLFAAEGTIEFWNEAITEELPQRIESLKSLTNLIQTDYMEQRELLLQPLRKARSELLSVIKDHYSVAKEMNYVITENVSSANQVQEKRKELLSKFMNTDKLEQRVDDYFQKADSILNSTQAALKKIETQLK